MVVMDMTTPFVSTLDQANMSVDVKMVITATPHFALISMNVPQNHARMVTAKSQQRPPMLPSGNFSAHDHLDGLEIYVTSILTNVLVHHV